MDFQTFYEGRNDGGLKYENKVIDVLKETGIVGNIHSGAGSNPAFPDADFKINDVIHFLEIKKNSKAPMGSLTASVNVDSKLIQIKNEESVEEDIKELVITSILSKITPIKRLLKFLQKRKPVLYNKSAIGIPFTVTKAAWDIAVSKGYIKDINKYVKNTVDFIKDHYRHKNTYYIQIGGAGLFYLSKNPAKLPIPQIKGDLKLELRTGPAGPKLNRTINELTNSVSLRISGNLRFKGKSPYTLDDPKSIQKMLMAMEK